MNLTELKQKPVQDLVKIAEEMGADNVGRLRKQDVIFTILKSHSSSGEDISGGGVLENAVKYQKVKNSLPRDNH